MSLSSFETKNFGIDIKVSIGIKSVRNVEKDEEKFRGLSLDFPELNESDFGCEWFNSRDAAIDHVVSKIKCHIYRIILSVSRYKGDIS